MKEIPLMAEIYQRSLLTISAALARSANDGFLHTAAPSCCKYFHPTALSYQGPDGGITKTLALTEREFHTFTDPIDRRAWTLQERLLCPRLLIYSSHGLIWSCRTLYHQSDYYEHLWTKEEPEWSNSATNTPTIPCLPRMKMQPWGNIVTQYSHREMSVPSDKLIALSAVAQTYSQNSEKLGTYLAGMWKNDMPTCLLWSVSRGTSRRALDEYRAPSWSWASVDGEISTHYCEAVSEDDLSAKVIQAETTVAVESIPFGAVTGGVLVLDVKALRCSVRMNGMFQWQIVNGPIVRVEPDTTDLKDSGSTVIHPTLLPMGHKAWYIVGLVVVEAGNDRYRRVGFFFTEMKNYSFFSGFERQRITVI
ncbi:hypothetical protein VP1G_10541 [Cytospora mali]|uniref:Heterokaryon incompatibility domain-containing protein n=1 Tax=Cytospora mali TaxID=578113 RepID=A0A194UMX0_CYTMA|nr:hypothetical protein VP1G_10541 [Valsa mali var. pyri (nom. inval.)]